MSELETNQTVDSPAPEKKESLISMIFDYLEILVFSVCVVLLLFTLCGRLCRVNGSSMRNTLYNGEMLVTTSLVQPEAGDIVVFHQTSDVYTRYNEPLVKRIIATEGQTVRIDYANGKVYVDGVLLEEPYAHLLNSAGKDIGRWTQAPAYSFDFSTGIFETSVPEGCYFVMGDNRNASADSRDAGIGMIDERYVVGTVFYRFGDTKLFNS
jgi:signal peptidase I